MRILIDIGHPAHVHFFKNFIREMEKRGHELTVTARDKDVAYQLLDACDIQFVPIGKIGKGKLNLVKEWIGRDWAIFKLTRKKHYDITTGIHNPCAAHIAHLTGAKAVIFTDSEPTRFASAVTFPFADVICTPDIFRKELGVKHLRFKGLKELAYLHPNYFSPDPAVLKIAGLIPGEKFVILRFIAWRASHDAGQHGFSLEAKRSLVEQLSGYARVLITSEVPLSSDLDRYRISVPPDKLHDLIYYASLVAGDSQTMTTEAAVLGTPAVRYNTFVGPDDMGNFLELENKYDLIYSFSDPARAIQKAVALIQRTDLKTQWAQKRQKLLEDKIDVTGFMVDFIENYPASLKKYKEQSVEI